MKELADKLDLTCMTVTGKTVGETQRNSITPMTEM